MNEITKAVNATPLVPGDMHDAIELAKMMANSTLVPREFQKQPANCLLVIMQAVRWEMDPFAVIQHTSIINGRPMYNGQLVAAVVNSRGNLRKDLDYEYGNGPTEEEPEGEGRWVRVWGQRQRDDEPKSTISYLDKVKTNNTQWVKQPDQQLAYHGSRVWARRYTPGLMLGVYSPEEFPRETAKAKVSADEAAAAIVTDENGEIVDPGPTKDELKEHLQQAARHSLQDLKNAANVLDVSHLPKADQDEVRSEFRRLRDSLQFVTMEDVTRNHLASNDTTDKPAQ